MIPLSKAWHSSLFFLALTLGLPAEEIRTTAEVSSWQFAACSTLSTPEIPVDGLVWNPVALPHVFRQSGLPDESVGWYQSTLSRPETDPAGATYFLRLEGAASVVDAYLNGQHLGQHRGAFTAAVFDLTPAWKKGANNLLQLRVTNMDAEIMNSLSRSGLYFTNGGLFRKVWLITCRAIHIYPDYGSCGVYVSATQATSEKAQITVRTVVRNTQPTSADVTAHHQIIDATGKLCGEFETSGPVPSGQTVTLSATGTLLKPRLWSLGHANLYQVKTELRVAGTVEDSVIVRTGFRTLTYAQSRFSLNGQEVQFRGTNKHAQSESTWNAISDEALRQDWQGIADLGFNAMRLPHYPHASLEYDLADELGIAVWAENGFAGQKWNTRAEEKDVSPGAELVTREMVRQNFNHPSILFWSCGNETIPETAEDYARVIREEDGSRLLTYAAPGGPGPKNCDFVAQNLYAGWYGGGNYANFDEVPRNALVAETGAGGWVTHHIPYGTAIWKVNKFEPEEYQQMVVEYRWQTVYRNHVQDHPMFFWWCFRDFYDHKFLNNRNTKGLLTMAGTYKDVAYLAKCFGHPEEKVVHLVGSDFFLRSLAPENGIKAYANTAQLELILNGTSQGRLSNGAYVLPATESKAKDGATTTKPGARIENVYYWPCPLRPGRNEVQVKDGEGHEDRMVIYQTDPQGVVPADPQASIVDLSSSNPANPAVFLDRPIEAQFGYYAEVDGSANNTLGELPPELQGSSWICSKRFSDPALKSNISFRINPAVKSVTVYVLASTGEYPAVTLLHPAPSLLKAAAGLAQSLSSAQFKDTGLSLVWRDHLLQQCNAKVWSRVCAAGEQINLPGQTLDYVVLVKKE